MRTRFSAILALTLTLALLFGCGSAGEKGPHPPGEEYLPLGTVVTVEGSSLEIMIIGYAATQMDSEDMTLWDYSGCEYPVGVLDPEQLYLFDHSMVENVLFEGYQTEDFQDFLPTVHDVLKDK